MLEEKIKLVLDSTENNIFMHKNQKIEVKPYLTIEDKMAIFDEYISILFDDNDENTLPARYIIAEHALILHIVDVCTNIEIADLNIDSFIECGLWSRVQDSIRNYQSFMNDLRELVELRRFNLSMERSVGTVLDTLSQKILFILSQLPEINSQEVQKIFGDFLQNMNQLNEKFPGLTDASVTPKKKRSYGKKEQLQ